MWRPACSSRRVYMVRPFLTPIRPMPPAPLPLLPPLVRWMWAKVRWWPKACVWLWKPCLAPTRCLILSRKLRAAPILLECRRIGFGIDPQHIGDAGLPGGGVVDGEFIDRLHDMPGGAQAIDILCQKLPGGVKRLVFGLVFRMALAIFAAFVIEDTIIIGDRHRARCAADRIGAFGKAIGVKADIGVRNHAEIIYRHRTPHAAEPASGHIQSSNMPWI